MREECNLKGVTSLFLAPQDITWMEELIDQTSQQLEEAYRILTLMEHDIFVFFWHW